MTTETSTPNESTEQVVNYDEIVGDLTAEEAESIVDDVEIDGPDGPMSLTAVMQDILVAHQDLTDYKKAAVAIEQALKERRLEAEAEAEGDEAVAAVISELEASADKLFQRLHRGDAEVLDGDSDAH